MATVIRIYPENGEDTGRSRMEFNLADFGGQLPACGDLIVKPKEAWPSNDAPELWEVVGRYFDPGEAFDGGACLRVLVRSRAVSEAERRLMG